MRTRKRPAPRQGNRPSPIATNCTESIALQGHDRVRPLDVEDRDDTAVLEAAYARGYRLAVKCSVCGHWLTSRKSLLDHIGPVCARRVAK